MLAAVVLAAGQSRRMGQNKLLLPLRGKPMFRHVVDIAAKTVDGPRILVTNTPEIAAYGLQNGFQIVSNLHSKQGIGTSVAVGCSCIPKEASGGIFFACDQPFLRAQTVQKLVRCYEAHNRIVVPTLHDVPKNPCIFPRRFFREICALDADRGGKQVYQKHSEEVVWVPMTGAREFTDIDTRVEYQAFSTVQQVPLSL